MLAIRRYYFKTTSRSRLRRLILASLWLRGMTLMLGGCAMEGPDYV
jgi:hypothetical protein